MRQVGCALLLGGLVAATASVGVQGAPTITIATQQPAPSDTGRKIYEREKCATCHQIAKRGNSRHPLDGVASRLTAEQIRRWLTHPAEMEASLPRMPALRMSTMKYRLSARDLDALVAYLETLR